MPEPSFDPSSGWWSIRVRLTPGSDRRTKCMLGKQPGWRKGSKPPKKVPEDVEVAARTFKDRERLARQGVDLSPVRSTDLRGFLEEYRVHREDDHKPGTARSLALAARHFLAYCDRHGVKSVQSVTLKTCEGFMAAARKSGTARSTVRTWRSMLSPAWSRGVRIGTAAGNPWKGAKLPGKPETPETEYWTFEEFERLLGAIDGWLFDAVLLAANTGPRVDSLLRLAWSDVDFANGLVTYRSKTGPYTVPLNPVARGVLERIDMTQKPRSPYVFPNPDTGEPRSRAWMFQAIEAAVKAAGLPEKGSYCHILRHTFASHALIRGVPLATVSKWLGHKSVAMTMRYSHLCKDESYRQMQDFSLGSDPRQQPPGGGTTPQSPGG